MLSSPEPVHLSQANGVPVAASGDPGVSQEIGTPAQISQRTTAEFTYDIMLLASFAALGFFTVALSIAFSNARPTPAGGRLTAQVLLGIGFFAMALRVAVTGQMLVTTLIPGFPWGVPLRIEYLSLPCTDPGAAYTAFHADADRYVRPDRPRGLRS